MLAACISTTMYMFEFPHFLYHLEKKKKTKIQTRKIIYLETSSTRRHRVCDYDSQNRTKYENWVPSLSSAPLFSWSPP